MLYKIKKPDIENSERMPVHVPKDVDLKEKDIENFLKSRLHEIVQEDQLFLIGQERARQEEADLLALDKNGVLYIFELKRWESQKENLLQVMRYGQIFGRYDYKKLENFAERQGWLDNKSLQDRHHEYFGLEKALSESEFNKNQVFVLVTHGLDIDTISAVEYWNRKGVKIECAPYHIYLIADEPYIQFNTYSPEHEIVVEHNTNYIIVNTNATWMEDAWESMLGEGKASAYYDRKYSITRIKKGDLVYLYHTAVGVIAKGTAKSGYEKAAVGGDPDEEFYIPLDFSGGWKLYKEKWEMAPNAGQINRRLESRHRFRQTVFSVSKEMAETIDTIYAENAKG